MEKLQVKRDHLKVLAGWVAEKLGRLKPNGQLLGYSPLSRLVELEALALGITGKLPSGRRSPRSPARTRASTRTSSPGCPSAPSDSARDLAAAPARRSRRLHRQP